ncbi:hypothetical protein VNO80_09413 [Phaseolus coccineus]|uniref:Uncharacterized protein n=1 Tax=Phaseolus coccineus TaxID=3886 RepID=A0AAN9RCG8_PHACN
MLCAGCDFSNTRTHRNMTPLRNHFYCFTHRSLLFPLVRANANFKAIYIMVLGLARMDSNNMQTDEQQQPVKSAPRVFCQRKKSGNGSFVSNLRNHFHDFIHASADEHKTCLRNTIQKILEASNFFGKNGHSTNEGDSVPLQSSTKN